MPSGYTAKLHDGQEQSFRNFVLEASRAMGAAIMQRDEGPGEIRLVEEEPDDYYSKSVVRDAEKLNALRNMTHDEWVAKEAADRHAANVAQIESGKKRVEIVDRYEAMLADVRKWVPPTDEHEGLKKFMIEQLEHSIKWDGPSESWDRLIVPRDIEEFKIEEIARAERSLDYAIKHRDEERERFASRNKWTRDLFDSLPQE